MGTIMSRTSELVQRVEKLESDLVTAKAELAKELGLDGVQQVVAVAPKQRKKRVPRKDGENSDKKNGPSLKDVVLGIIAKNPNGIGVKAIMAEVVEMKKSGKYHTKADNVSGVVSQAVASLKAEDAVIHDRENRTYKPKASA